MNKLPTSRRNFLAALGLATSMISFYDPVRELLRSMVLGKIRGSEPPPLGGNAPVKNFVQFNLYGAPTRWQFDHPLRPYEGCSFRPMAGVYNRIRWEGSVPHGEYADVPIHGINLPHLWSMPVMGSGGSLRPMRDLAQNMLVIRGCDLGSNGHPLPNEQLICPTGGLTLNGVVADAANSYLPAINVGAAPASMVFRSRRGSFALNVPAECDDYAAYILDPFFDGGAAKQSLDEAEAAMYAYGVSNNPGAEILYRDRRQADQLFRSGVADLKDAFPGLMKKYDRLFHGSMHSSPVPGVTDRKIPGASFPFEVKTEDHARTALAAYHLESKVVCAEDIRTIFASARANYIVKQFALAEFVLTQKLSSSLVLSPPSSLERANFLLTNLGDFDYVKLNEINHSSSADGKQRFEPRSAKRFQAKEYQLVNDSHATGWLVNVVSCSLFYLGFGACLLELIDQLKSAGSGHLFDHTVIQVASEFDRIPVHAGAGLEHNPRANVTSIFSGMVKEPLVLGNIYAAEGGQTEGTVGIAAPVDALGGQTIRLSHISSTLSEMLQVEKIDPTAPSLVSIRTGKVEPEIEKAKNV